MVANTPLSNFMAYNPFVNTHTNLLANNAPSAAAAAASLYSLSNPVVSSVVANAVGNQTGIVSDHRTSSIAALRLKAREHTVALGTI